MNVNAPALPVDRGLFADWHFRAALYWLLGLTALRLVIVGFVGLGDVPVSSPDRGVLKRISALLAERIATR